MSESGAMVTKRKTDIASPSDQLVLEDSDGPAGREKKCFSKPTGQF